MKLKKLIVTGGTLELLMTELQYYSPGRQIFFWFGSAYGVLQNSKGNTYLKYIASEEKIQEALANGTKSARPWVDELLERERENCGIYNPQMKGASDGRENISC